MYLSTKPLKNLDELLNWSPPKLPFFDNNNWVANFDRKKKNKVLFCHDMMGGYLEDRFHFGSENIEYSFCYWHLVDVFVYFSHHFITIPPLNWIQSARNNSTPILGTLITEGVIGEQICYRMLESDSVLESVVSKLVEIAKVFNLSGWLVNIENSVKSQQVPRVVRMLKLLTNGLKQVIGDPIVVWYDSILDSGQLFWQNELNDRNRLFLEDTGVYMFTNYWWDESNLRRMRTRFGHILDRIFVGVDVFGRGVRVGGAGFDISEAVELSGKYDLSVALFAPGWTWETFRNEEIYWDMEKLFWEGLAQLIESRSYPLPFKSSFCRGFGRSTWNFGKKLGDQTWYQIGLQQPQLNFCQSISSSDGIHVDYSDSFSFSGGNCLRFTIPKTPHSLCKDILKIVSSAPRLGVICYYSVPEEFAYDLSFKVLCKSGESLTVKVRSHFRMSEIWHKKTFIVSNDHVSPIESVSLSLTSKFDDREEHGDTELFMGQLEIFEETERPLPCLNEWGYSVNYSLRAWGDRYLMEFKDCSNYKYFIIWREGDAMISSFLEYLGRTFLPYFVVDVSETRYLVEGVLF